MVDKCSVLVVEDSLPLAQIYQAYMGGTEYEPRHAENLQDATKALQAKQPDIILLDVELPDGSGIDFLKKVMLDYQGVQVIVMTAHGSSNMALEAIDIGATDFLTKPFDAARLLVTLKNAREHLLIAKKANEIAFRERSTALSLIGGSAIIQNAHRLIESLAARETTVLVLGEPGTGKDATAKYIHEHSDRSDKTFISVDCQSQTGIALERELFGSANFDTPSLLKQAEGGTLYLNSVSQLSLEGQRRLLVFIRTGNYSEVGGNQRYSADVRIVCGSDKVPDEEISSGRLSRELYGELEQTQIDLPPLRERKEDIALIAEKCLYKANEQEDKCFLGFSADVKELLVNYEWPRNIKELASVIQNIVVMNSGEEVSRAMLPKKLLPEEKRYRQTTETDWLNLDVHQFGRADLHASADQIKPLWLVEREAIEQAIELCGGNVNRAASYLEVAPSTIYRKVQQWSKPQNKNKVN